MLKFYTCMLLSLFLVTGLSAEVQWMHSLEEAQKVAIEEDKLLLVDFYAWWCGPCKKMDSEVWVREDVTKLSENFVAVKVDMDTEKALCTKYRVSGIPTIMIMDAYGGEMYKNVGYMDFGAMNILLSSFPHNVAGLNSALANLVQDEKDALKEIDVALAYQAGARSVEGEGRRAFLMKSDQYLTNAAKHGSKAGLEYLDERCALLSLINDAYRGKGKKAMTKFLKKIPESSVSEKNKAAMYYAFAVCSREAGDKKNLQKYTDKLTSMEGVESWIEEWNKGADSRP